MATKSPLTAPKTLLEAVAFFADEDVALNFVVALHPGWENGPVCPRCASDKVGFLATRRLWKCKACAKQFSAKVGTIFEDSAISLTKWLPAMWQIVNCKNGISSYELARAIGVTQKTAWFMLSRLRLAMQDNDNGGKLGGTVEVDETFIGGRARNMHESKRKQLREIYESRGPSAMGKVVVMGLLERNTTGASRVRTMMLTGRDTAQLMGRVNEHVEAGSVVNTDEHKGYGGLIAKYQHKVINHAETYVQGNVHTNSMENFWSLLKRAIKGTYVSIEPFHLFRYLDEQSFRFNNRKMTDAQRFLLAAASIFGRRLTYEGLTGHVVAPTN